MLKPNTIYVQAYDPSQFIYNCKIKYEKRIFSMSTKATNKII